MKRIIDGKRYDTETADLIGSNGAGYAGDFHAWYETLYRTKKGAFFLCGNGGALSSWGRATGNGNERCGGEGIRPLDVAEALTWCEANLEPEDFEGLFEIEEA